MKLQKNNRGGVHLFLPLLIIVVAIGGVGYGVYRNSSKSDTVADKADERFDKRCEDLSDEYNLKPLVDCRIEDVESLQHVHISSGEGADCPAGCIYNQDHFILDPQGSEHRVPARPRYDKGLTHASATDYGCSRLYPTKQSLTFKQGSYYWVDEFVNVVAQQTHGYTCIVNGKILYAYQKDRPEYPKEYFVGFDVLYKNVPKDCNAATYVAECLTDLARVTKDKKYCRLIKDSYGSGMTNNSCYSALAISTLDDSICDNISVTSSDDSYTANQELCDKNVQSRKVDVAFAKSLE